MREWAGLPHAIRLDRIEGLQVRRASSGLKWRWRFVDGRIPLFGARLGRRGDILCRHGGRAS